MSKVTIFLKLLLIILVLCLSHIIFKYVIVEKFISTKELTPILNTIRSSIETENQEILDFLNNLNQGKVITYHHLLNNKPMNPWYIYVDNKSINYNESSWGKNFYNRFRGFITPNKSGEHRIYIKTSERYNFSISQTPSDYSNIKDLLFPNATNYLHINNDDAYFRKDITNSKRFWRRRYISLHMEVGKIYEFLLNIYRPYIDGKMLRYKLQMKWEQPVNIDPDSENEIKSDNNNQNTLPTLTNYKLSPPEIIPTENFLYHEIMYKGPLPFMVSKNKISDCIKKSSTSNEYEIVDQNECKSLFDNLTEKQNTITNWSIGLESFANRSNGTLPINLVTTVINSNNLNSEEITESDILKNVKKDQAIRIGRENEILNLKKDLLIDLDEARNEYTKKRTDLDKKSTQVQENDILRKNWYDRVSTNVNDWENKENIRIKNEEQRRNLYNRMNRGNYYYNRNERWRLGNELSRIGNEKIRINAEKKRIENQALVLNQENTTTPLIQKQNECPGNDKNCHSKGGYRTCDSGWKPASNSSNPCIKI